jgi:hypothetical protein
MVLGAGNSMICTFSRPPGNRAGLPETTAHRMQPLGGKRKEAAQDAGWPVD